MSYDKEQLASLLARVEAATGPDRELGVDILICIGGWSCSEDFELSDHEGKMWSRAISPRKRPGLWEHMNPALSIDAALALVRRVLPGWDYELTYFAAHGAIFILWDEGLRVDWEMRTWSEARTAPLAIIASLLKGLIAQTEALPTGVSVGDPEGRDD